MPAPKKRPETLRRRNPPPLWIVLPLAAKALPPRWPLSTPSKPQRELWGHLWRLPVAAYWREQAISPYVIARYVVLATTKPQLAVVSRLEDDLGLTPGAMAKLHVVVEEPEARKTARRNRYMHVVVDEEP